MSEHEIYGAIIESTESELILFFIVAAIAAAVVFVPTYVAMLKDRKAARKHEADLAQNAQNHELESRQQIIDVVTRNTEVMASLDTTLRNTGEFTVHAFDRIHERLDEQNATSKALHVDISLVSTKIFNVLETQREIGSKVNKIFVIASGGNLKRRDDKTEGTDEQ